MKILVRAIEPSDCEAIRDIMLQPRAQAGTLQVPYPSLEMWKKRLSDLTPGDYVLVAEVEVEADKKLVGHLGLHAIAKSRRRAHAAMVGITVHDAWHGKGVGSALLKAALDLADNWLQYKRLELEVYVDNLPAIALYKKFGFEVEGTLRMFAFREGEYVDAHVMSRLKK